MKSPIQLFIAIAILLATATVAAQVYKWVDKDGKVQYSDQAPPAGVTKVEAKKVETGNAAASAPSAAPSLQDRSKDYDKRQKDAAAKEKKAAETQKDTEADAENCKNAKSVLRDLEGEKPVRRTNEQGDTVFMTDEERQASIAKARAASAASCKA